MGKIFTLSQGVKNVALAAFTDLVQQLGRSCRMMYPPHFVKCSNCVFDNIGKKSSNIWYTGGPAPFPLGSQCPMCLGAGTIPEQQYDDVLLLIQEDVSKFQKIGSLNFPDGTIQTKGFLIDLPKIQRADYMIKHVSLSNILPQKYKLLGEPVCPGNIVQSEFFVCLWERIAQ